VQSRYQKNSSQYIYPMGLTFCLGKSMTPSRIPLALVLVMVAVLLAAGCTVGMGNYSKCGVTANGFYLDSPLCYLEKATPPPITVPPQPVTSFTFRLSIPPATNLNEIRPYWIQIDPVYNKNVGDKLTILGLTNLPVGQEVRCEIKSDVDVVPLRNASAAVTIVRVTSGENGVNKIVLNIDSRELVPDEYVYGPRGSVNQVGYALTERALWKNAKNGTYIVLDSLFYDISLDPISDKEFGNKFTVTGTTNLPHGERVLLSVHSLTNSSPIVTESIRIFNGNNSLNKTTFVVDTSTFPRVEYDKYVVSEEYDYFHNNIGWNQIQYQHPATRPKFHYHRSMLIFYIEI
jgi:hypothetical protein